VIDPKWLEFLNVAGPKTAAVAFACGIFLLLARIGLLPPLDAWVIQLAAFAFILSACLAIFSLGTAFYEPIRKRIVRSHRIRTEQKALRKYIPHMLPKEREIIGFLLSKNQKMFTGASDGGYARTLISRRIIVRALIPGQGVDYDAIPYAIHDHIWDVLVQHKDEFPYRRTGRGIDPWREPNPYA
jgi:hypothetical protein